MRSRPVYGVLEPRPGKAHLIVADGGDEEALRFIDDVMALPDVPRAWRHQRFDETPTPVLSVDFRKGDTKLRLFTTIATFGTPQDISLQEQRILRTPMKSRKARWARVTEYSL